MRQLFCLLYVLLVCAACQSKQPDTPTEEPFYAPDFTLQTLDGTVYTLSALRGQWVIVTFWATNCPPCIEDMPLLQQMVDDADGRLVVLGVNMREEKALIQPFVERLALRFPILLDPYDQMLLDYNVIGLPQTLLITPTGEIIDRRFGLIDVEVWENIIEIYGQKAITRHIVAFCTDVV